MKLRLTTILLFVSAAFAQAGPPFTLPAGNAPSIVEKAHAATLEIGQKTIAHTAVCAATAIGPHAIITASHCELPTDDLFIDSVDKDVTIVGRIRDTYDHSIYLLDGVTFTDYADVKIADPLDQGEELFFFGNPADFVDLYRKGFVAGYRRETDEVLLQIDAFPGDSGAALFNSKGEIAGLITEVVLRQMPGAQIQFTGCFRLQFTEADIERARKFVPPAAK
jgi:hypothetical protein